MLDARKYLYKLRNLENRIAERTKNAALEIITLNEIDYSEAWEKLEKMMKEA